MNLSFYWVDAFADRLFRGNPAGVVPLERWPEDEALLQRIATENGLSETAFFVPSASGAGRYSLRWFTPKTEVKLCGHATLASAHILFSRLGEASPLLRFETLSGELQVRRLGDGWLELDFPASPPTAAPHASEDFTQALGAAPELVLRNDANWFCVFGSEESVRNLKPDFRAVAAIAPGRVIVTAPGKGSVDFVSRFFAPGVGIDEDPVTGSAHCGLIPYWAERLGKKTLRAEQVSARGGVLRCEEREGRVGIAGQAITYLEGRLCL